MSNFLRHIVLLFKREEESQSFETVINADPTQDHFPHINFDLTLESDNPYPSGSLNITNIHQLGVAALPGGVCVVRAGYYQPNTLPPVIYAGRPFSIETQWQGTESITTIGLGLPNELFYEVTVKALKRAKSVARLITEQAGSRIRLDRDTVSSALQVNNRPIMVPKGYTAGPKPFSEWLTEILNNETIGTNHYWIYQPDELLNLVEVKVFHQLRTDPNRSVRINHNQLTALPAPKIALDGASGINFETVLNHNIELTSGIDLEFRDPGRRSSKYSRWRPVRIQHIGDNFTGNFRTNISARAVLGDGERNQSGVSTGFSRRRGGDGDIQTGRGGVRSGG